MVSLEHMCVMCTEIQDNKINIISRGTMECLKLIPLLLMLL